MVLTVVVGSSGSGKTTFLDHTVKCQKCIYIKQYHNIRPYVTVSKIPNFDPRKLPYWHIYDKEGKTQTIKVGGTMAGEFTAGLSGGQRKLMLFELIYQRVASQKGLLLVLDEPFAGVTDNFVPFIVDRLSKLRQLHNVLLVTNDHVEHLKELADNTITISSLDRSVVKVNGNNMVNREKAILGLAVGNDYEYKASSADTKFFFDVEILSNGTMSSVAIFCCFAFTLFIAAFWDSSEQNAALVVVASSIISFFCINPYFLSLVDWRNYMTEEAEALLHASKRMNKCLMTMLAIALCTVVSLIQWATLNAVVSGFESPKFWLALMMDSLFLKMLFIILGLFSKLKFHLVQILAAFPFLFVIFFSTTFSPGAGLSGLKALRYLFPRYYFWCMIPSTQPFMEGCPEKNNILYLFCVSLLPLIIFFVYKGMALLRSSSNKREAAKKHDALKDDEFTTLQSELFGVASTKKGSLAESIHSGDCSVVEA